MTTEYSVKRCKSFGFAQSMKNAITLFTPDEYAKSNVYYVHSSKPSMSSILEKLKPKELINITDINELVPAVSSAPTTKTSSNNIIFVELGVKSNKTIKQPIEYDDIDLVKVYCENEHISSDFEHAILTIISNPDEAQELKEHKFSNEFLQFIIELYPQLRDYKLKSVLLDLLAFNDYNTFQLEKDNPFDFEEKTIESVVAAPMFDDIEISIDVNDKNTSSSLYKPDKDSLKQAALGKTTQLDAFSENKFAIIHTKKHAGIETKIRNQNHDVLDTLAVNGVMKSPETNKPLSMYQLMIKLEQFKQFSIVFIHPAYEVKAMIAEYPCEQIIPSYTVNQGELLAVAYRYIVMRFFGYCSIFTDSMLEWRYYI